MLEPSLRMDFPLEVGAVGTEPKSENPAVDQLMPEINSDMPPPHPLPAGVEDLQREIEDVKALVRTEPHGNDLRMLLFTVAASNDRYESTLVPLPPQFRAVVGYGCQVKRLRSAIENNWPACRVIPTMFNSPDELQALAPDDVDAWHLLHWLLVPIVTYPSFRRLSILNLGPLCRNLGLGQPTEEPRQLMGINYEMIDLNQWKWRLQNDEQRNYAFLGLPLAQVYRFLYTGHLDIPPGEPIRLHHQMEFALLLSQQLELPAEHQQEQEQEQEEQQQQQEEQQGKQKKEHQKQKLCWSNSVLANTQQRAIIICELPAELDNWMASSPDRHFLELLVQDSSTLKPCYLLMFDEPVAAKMMQQWPGKPIEMQPLPGRSLRKGTSHRFSQMSNYVFGRLDALKRLVKRSNSTEAAN